MNAGAFIFNGSPIRAGTIMKTLTHHRWAVIPKNPVVSTGSTSDRAGWLSLSKPFLVKNYYLQNSNFPFIIKTGMKNLKEIILRVVILMIGLCVAHLGVTLFLLADLGADPFNVLIQGLFRTLQKFMDFKFLTHGNVHLVISFLIILILLIVDRSYIKIGTVLCMAFGGPIIDVFTILLGPVFETYTSIIFRVIALAAGCVILAFGMTIVIKSEAGTGPNDLVAVVISDKLKKKFSIIRMIVDFTFVLVGFLLGGAFGAGTIICAFLVGPVAGIFLPLNEKWIKKVVIKMSSEK